MKVRKKKFSIVISFFVGVVVALIAFGYIGLHVALFPMDYRDTTEQTVVVPKGASIISIGNLLYKKGLIRSPLIFRYVVWKEGLSSGIQAGSYTLSKSMSAETITQSMTKGTADVWVTLPEGWRNEEIADELEQTLQSETFNKQEFLSLVKDKQGMLFPDTYLFPKQANAQMVVNVLTSTFDKKITDTMKSDMKKQGRTLEAVLVLASLVQREAKHAQDMNMVAGIMMNRLNNNQALQIDATLQYIKGYDSKNKTWWPVPLAKDKEISSPYNTYAHPGLPPKPIANPGIEAIMAAIYPQTSDYYYYITDDNGVMHYAKTFEEHNANIHKYLY